MSKTEELQEQIRRAFSDREPYADKVTATESPWPGSEEGRAEEIFGGKAWEQIDLERLAFNRSTIPALTPSAFTYFLPALMLATITPTGFDYLTDFVLLSLTPSYPALEQRLLRLKQALSEEQQKAVRQFILYIGEMDDFYLTDDSHAGFLKQFWQLS